MTWFALVAAALQAAGAAAPQEAGAGAGAGGGCRPWGFVHIPKCGGTGMLSTLTACCHALALEHLAKNDSWRPKRGIDHFWFHSSAIEQRMVVGPRTWDGAYTFVFVRNPWDVFISRVFWKSASAALLPHTEAVQVFRRFFRRRYQEIPPGSWHDWKWMQPVWPVNEEWGYFGPLQWYWFTSPDGKILVDDVIKLEELERSWPKLQRRICGLAAVSFADHSTRGRGLNAGRGAFERGGLPPESGLLANVSAQLAGKPKRRRQDYYDNETRYQLAGLMALDIRNLNYSFDDP
eukprot:TRINITY_DN9027_c0_g1_i3.p1 TRINITY_DN9027_c0_g1~~TRINITY_DN9027_c0_g1_i3.p1  ORF type:complete len:318 (+),score=35.35 TRINITY_DN9027_c0_g1_i3:83-955(+)